MSADDCCVFLSCVWKMMSVWSGGKSQAFDQLVVLCRRDKQGQDRESISMEGMPSVSGPWCWRERFVRMDYQVPSDRVYACRGEGGEILPSTPTPNSNQPFQRPTFTLYFDGKDDECDGATFAQVILIWMTNVMVATSAPFYLKSEMI